MPTRWNTDLVFRPWGSFDVLHSGSGFQVKRLIVNPGAAISLQCHSHRSEHWVVSKGVATVTKGKDVFTLAEAGLTTIPVGVLHRMENREAVPLEVIEVQQGDYLGEDDIIRFDDRYGRSVSVLPEDNPQAIGGGMPKLLSEVFAPMEVGPSHEYPVKITRVVDGDTVDADIDLGFNEYKKDRIRLIGIDTPESRTRNKKEKVLGLASKARLKELIANAPVGKRGKKIIYLKTTKDGKGKFGRILGTLFINGIDVCETLIDEGHARAYFGGAKNALGPWTKEVDGVWYRWTAGGYIQHEEQ